MAEFCTCGSLVIRGNCLNKKCKEHKKSLVEPATYEQMNYITSLRNQLNQPVINDEVLSKIEASRLIDKLKEQIEMGIE